MTWETHPILSSISAKLEERHLATTVVDQHLAYHAAVLRGLEHDLAVAYPAAEYLGMGGSGVAIKLVAPVADQPPLEKCVKYPQPTIGQSTPFSLAEVLDKEAEALRSLHHEHIIPLDTIGRLTLDDSIPDRDRDVPFYTMPCVDSVELPLYIASPHVTPHRIVRLLREIASALDYMHRAGFVHLDVKPENIFVQDYRGGEPTALLADFGFCKRITPRSEKLTMIMVTDGYVHPELLREMATRSDTNRNRLRDRVARNVLNARFDRFAFGVTIVNSLVQFLRFATPTRARTFPTGLLRGLQLIAARCSDGHPLELRNDEDQQRVTPDNLFQPTVANFLKYQDTADLLRNMNTLASNFREYSMEPEIADVDSTIICLPPRSFAQLSDRVKLTLDATPVRRLANVSQLALRYHVYPGAAHTRKEHMLGTYETAATLLRHLLFDSANPLCALLLTEKHQRLTLLGALIHDFGHIALLHELEDALPDLLQDTYMREIVDGLWGDAAFQEEIEDICRAWDVTRDDLRALFGSNQTGGDWRERYQSIEMEFVRSILDGAIDVDKIDYLQRDALHAGVQYGHGVDVERLERRATAAMWVTLEESRFVPHFRLAAWQSAQPAAEAVISARHNMHAQVYGHRTVRAARAMLNYVAWCWNEADCYQGLTSKRTVDRLYRYASLLEGPAGQLPLNTEPAVQEPRLGLRDNLAYGEAPVIRWMAAVSANSAATALAEALIQRDLYKEVRALEESAVQAFLDRAYPPSGRGGFKYRERCDFGPKDWISLTAMLSARVRSFLAARSASMSRPLTESEQTPEVLIDVAIPKTMRTQRELVIVTDHLGGDVSWRRLEHPAGQKGTVMGLEVIPSPIYEFFGGRASGDRASRITVRLFARPDLADALRTHLDGGLLADWLNGFVPDHQAAPAVTPSLSKTAAPKRKKR